MPLPSASFFFFSQEDASCLSLPSGPYIHVTSFSVPIILWGQEQELEHMKQGRVESTLDCPAHNPGSGFLELPLDSRDPGKAAMPVSG